jgi:hypothetical protein
MHVADKDLTTSLAEQADGLTAAVYARFETALSPSRWLGPLGNYLIARPAARTAALAAQERTDVPLDAAVVLGLTDAELHVWAADPMLSHVNDHLGSVPLERVAGVSAEVGKSWWPLKLELTDGESVEMSARGDVRAFLAAFEQRAGRPAV